MSAKRSFWYSCVLLMAGLLSVAPSSSTYSTIVQNGCQPTDCPPCYFNGGTLAGSGTPEGSTRRLLNVFIDFTWGSPSNPNYENIRVATEEAINGINGQGGWNHAGDFTCSPNPALTGYFLQIVPQTTPENLRDIVIRRDDNIASCALNMLCSYNW